ncbi:MAG: YgeY family selenium metabolism-linked hydrolase [Anaerolineae bacterium]|jgi:putative selenium metabolism hydrolase
MSSFKLRGEDRARLLAFLRDLVRTPSPSTQERAVAERIVREMRDLGFPEVWVDAIGNVVGRVGPGNGPTLMLNAHMDTVRVSARDSWARDPFEASVENGILYGLGSCDMKGGLAAMLYGAKMVQDAGATLKGDLVVACVVQEEECEGLGTRVLIEEGGLRPDWVVLGEPTDLNVSRGQRGRLEMRLVTHGRSAHAASPHLGENAIYIAARLVFGLELLAEQLAEDEFLGQGTLAVTDITSSASSRNAVPDSCAMIIDRRLTLGENETKALAEVQRVIAREGVSADVEVTRYRTLSYTGYECDVREFFPAWVIAADHPLVSAAVRAAQTELERRPQVTRWGFSTEGVYTAGEAGIPTVGLGPGREERAHTADEHVQLRDVYAAAAIYAQLAMRLLG